MPSSATHRPTSTCWPRSTPSSATCGRASTRCPDRRPTVEQTTHRSFDLAGEDDADRVRRYRAQGLEGGGQLTRGPAPTKFAPHLGLEESHQLVGGAGQPTAQDALGL